MSEPLSAIEFSENNVRVAEEEFRSGNLNGALEILHELTFVLPNTSTNHRKISQVHVAHELHWMFINNRFALFNIFDISPPCNYQSAHKKYMNIVAKLCPEKNKSVAAKLAWKIINVTWMISCDTEGSNVRNIQQELRNIFREGESLFMQSVREGKRPCVDIIDTDSDSDSDSD